MMTTHTSAFSILYSVQITLNNRYWDTSDECRRPEVLVEPEGLDWGNDFEALSGDSSVPEEMEELEDTLLELFRTGALLPKEQFLVELEKQRRRSPERCTAN